MRPPADDWLDFRAAVPLTGREPVLGGLRSRLASRAADFGWVTIAGPPGSGVSRLLEEAADLLEADGLPRPLRLRPGPPGFRPLDPLREALRAGLGQAGRFRLLASLTPLLAGVPQGPAALAWLAEDPGTDDPPAPSSELARRILAVASGGRLVLADDLHLLDPATRAVLEGGASPDPALGVLAGTTAEGRAPTPGVRLALEPLTEGQVHLLLKRWLRDAGTAQRLAPELFRSSGGWPGRVVRAVRDLALAGVLVPSERGVRLTPRPRESRTVVAAGPSTPATTFLAWARLQGPSVRRLLEVAAVAGDPLDPDLLARACGVKRAVAADFLRQAEATGADRAASWLFPEPGAREALLVEMGPSRLREIADHLAEAWRSRAPAASDSISEARRRTRASLLAGRDGEAMPAALHLADRLAAARWRDAAALATLADAVAHSPPDAPEELVRTLVLATVDRTTESGRLSEALRVLRHPVSRRVCDPRRLPAAWRLARLERGAGRPAAALSRVAKALAADPPAPGTAEAFEAFAERALAQAAATPGRGDMLRAAWREALPHLSPADVDRRRRVHLGLAEAAERSGRIRAAHAHLRRAAALSLALGDPAGAAAARLCGGRLAARAGDFARALETLDGARRGFLGLADTRGEADALHEMGRVCLGLDRFDDAAEHLEAALELAKRAPALVSSPAPSRFSPCPALASPVASPVASPAVASPVHLSLAHAYEGRGDLAAARRHASLALTTEGGAEVALRAALVLARTAARAGDLGAASELARCEAALRDAGHAPEAVAAAHARTDALLRAGDAAWPPPAGPSNPPRAIPHRAQARLLLARAMIAGGDAADARLGFSEVAADAAAPVHLRAEAYARLACALLRAREPEAASHAASAAAALLEVCRRSRAEDVRVHRMLAAAFGALGERARAILHRAEARRLATRLARAVQAPATPGGRRALRLLDPVRAPRAARSASRVRA